MAYGGGGNLPDLSNYSDVTNYPAVEAEPEPGYLPDGHEGLLGSDVSEEEQDNDDAEEVCDFKSPADHFGFRTNLDEMRRRGVLCDVELEVEGVKIAAHKVVLSAGSLYFEAMFRRGNFNESRSSNVRIDPEGELGITAASLELLVQYLYTGKLRTAGCKVMDLMRAANLLQLPAVRDEAIEEAKRLINVETFSEFRAAGRLFDSPQLVEAVGTFVRNNFSAVTRSKRFLEIGEEDLIAYLGHDRLTSGSEEKVLDAVMRWCRGEDRMSKFPTVVQVVRFDLVPINHVLQTIRKHDLIKEHPTAASLLIERLEAVSLSNSGPNWPLQRFNAHVLAALPVHSEYFWMVRILGGEHIHFEKRCYPEVFSKRTGRYFFTACQLGNHQDKLLLCGGIEDDDDGPKAWKTFIYDVTADRWCEVKSLLGDKSFRVGCVNGRIYAVVDGEESSFRLGEVIECLNGSSSPHYHELSNCDRTGKGRKNRRSKPKSLLLGSEPIALMDYDRSHAVFATVGQRLYAIGGMLDGGYTSMVEYYDPASDTWEEVDSMNHARFYPGVAVHDHKIYVVGGIGDGLLGRCTYESAEVYDTIKDKWTNLPNMNLERMAPAVTVVNDSFLYVMGGEREYVRGTPKEGMIEVFDLTLEKWTILETRFPPLHCHSNRAFASVSLVTE